MKVLSVFVSLVTVPFFVQGFVGGGANISSNYNLHLQQPSSSSSSFLRLKMKTNIDQYHRNHHTYNDILRPSSSSSSSFTTTTRLYSSDIPQQMEEDKNMSTLRQRDPIQFLKLKAANMDFNVIINAAILILVSIAVLDSVVTIDADIMRGWTTEEKALRIPIDNWNSYSAILDKSPIFTKAVTSATVYTIGDLIAQTTEGKGIGDVDRIRVIRSLLAGLIGHGPLSHVWYDVSENLFENVMHLQGWFGTIIKVVIDQTTWGPIWNNTYILLLGLMKFDKLENIFAEIKRTTIPLIISGLKLWPLAHIVTYGLIPVENRLLWVDLVEIIWVTILATAAAGGKNGEQDNDNNNNSMNTFSDDNKVDEPSLQLANTTKR